MEKEANLLICKIGILTWEFTESEKLDRTDWNDSVFDSFFPCVFCAGRTRWWTYPSGSQMFQSGLKEPDSTLPRTCLSMPTRTKWLSMLQVGRCIKQSWITLHHVTWERKKAGFERSELRVHWNTWVGMVVCFWRHFVIRLTAAPFPTSQYYLLMDRSLFICVCVCSLESVLYMPSLPEEL